MYWIRRCCGQAVSTGASMSTCRISGAANRFSKSICAKCRLQTMSMRPSSRAARLDFPALIWPIWSIERRYTAYHESGHAVVAKLLPHADPVHKVTIMPRGAALGLTWQLPEYDRVNLYRDKMLEEIAILFGGRVAEELFLNSMSTGASNDFERATKMARDMVTRYGMSDSLGTMVYVNTEQDTLLGRMA